MMRATNSRTMFRPKLPERPRQCASCPFRDGNDREFGEVVDRLASSVGVLPDVAETRRRVRLEANIMGDFACHETAYDGAMKLRAMEHRRQCPGATRHFIAFGALHAPDRIGVWR